MQNALQSFQNTPQLVHVGTPRCGRLEGGTCTQPQPHRVTVGNWGGT